MLEEEFREREVSLAERILEGAGVAVIPTWHGVGRDDRGAEVNEQRGDRVKVVQIAGLLEGTVAITGYAVPGGVV